MEYTVKVYKSRNEGLTVTEGYAVGGHLLPVLLSGVGGIHGPGFTHLYTLSRPQALLPTNPALMVCEFRQRRCRLRCPRCAPPTPAPVTPLGPAPPTPCLLQPRLPPLASLLCLCPSPDRQPCRFSLRGEGINSSTPTGFSHQAPQSPQRSWHPLGIRV